MHPILQRAFSHNNFAIAFESGKNSFGFLRLLFASLVLYSHAFALGALGPEPLLGFTQGKTSLGGLSVMSFFVISGFLITGSLERSSSVVSFAWSRVLRIYPGYLTCLVMGSTVFASAYCLLEGRDIADFFQQNYASVISYVTANSSLKMRQYGIGSLLDSVAYPKNINGSLWSLILEWRCYVVVGILGFFAKSRNFLGFFLLACAAAYASGIMHTFQFDMPAIFPKWYHEPPFGKFSAYFFTAGACYFLRAYIPNSPILFLSSVLAFRFGLKSEWLAVIGPLSLSYAVLWLAFNLPQGLAWFDKVGDVSYGVYIYAFPVQQLLADAGIHRLGLVTFLSASMIYTLCLAILSHRFIEEPALRLKKRWPLQKLGPFLKRKWLTLMNPNLEPQPLIVKEEIKSES